MTLKILLKNGLLLIDDADAWVLEQYRWYSTAPDERCRIIYARTKGVPGQPSISMHRLLLDAPFDMDVDHINGNGLDNRRENIRLATTSQNCMNRHARLVAYKGVTQSSKTTWRAKIKVNGRPIYLGSFSTPEEAALAYADAADETFGEFANHDRVRALAALAELTDQGLWPVASPERPSHCKRGHALTTDNLYFRPDREGRSTECLTCRRESARRSHQRQAS